MTGRRERVAEVLHGCAEAGAAGGTDPWPGIRARASAMDRGSREIRLHLVPHTRLGWAFAVVAMVLVFGTGAYAVSEVTYEEFRHWLPGADRGEAIGTPVNQTRTTHGVRVTIERVYADERYVAVISSVRDLEADRRVDGFPADVFGYSSITDESGNRFKSVDGSGINTGEGSGVGDPEVTEPTPGTEVFLTRKKITPDERHRFRLKVDLIASLYASKSSPGDAVLRDERLAEPLVFEFEVPVRPAPVIEPNESDTAKGVTLTLERIENSPARPEAIVCFEPPDDEHLWGLGSVWGNPDGAGKVGFDPRGGVDLKVPGQEKPIGLLARGGQGRDPQSEDANRECTALPLIDRGAGEYKLIVPGIMGFTKGQVEEAFTEGKGMKTIRGPWRLDFELPESEAP